MRGIKIGRLKINILMIPAVIILVALGMGDVVLCTVPALLLHEWSHILAAAAAGMQVTQLELFPFGCAAKMQCFAVSRAKEIIVAAAGPAANMLAACALFVINRYYCPFDAAGKLIAANLAIATVNLLPALPLDGGRIARAAFANFLGYKRATKLTAAAGIFFAAVITGLGIYIALTKTINPGYFVMGFFLLLSSITELKSAPYTLIRDFSGKRERMQKHKTISVNRFAAMQGEKLSDIMREFEPGKYNIVTVLDKDMGVLGELDERRILDAMMEKGANVTLRGICNGKK